MNIALGTSFLILFAIAVVGMLLYVKFSLSSQVKNLEEKFINQKLTDQQIFSAVQQNVSLSLERISKDIGELTGVSRNLLAISSSFDNLLKNPSYRGGLGEILLEKMIADILPRETFERQLSFSNGLTADILIKTPQGNLAIDSKFSFETFKNYSTAQDEKEREQLKKIFLRSIKTRIDETSKYILPQEHTFDFACMYVPSEAVYYEIITNDEIAIYAQNKKVFLTGPNTLLVYLRTLLIGFKGLTIERQAQLMLNEINNLEKNFLTLNESIKILGGHLKNSLAKHREIEEKILSLSLELKHLTEEKNSP